MPSLAGSHNNEHSWFFQRGSATSTVVKWERAELCEGVCKQGHQRSHSHLTLKCPAEKGKGLPASYDNCIRRQEPYWFRTLRSSLGYFSNYSWIRALNFRSPVNFCLGLSRSTISASAVVIMIMMMERIFLENLICEMKRHLLKNSNDHLWSNEHGFSIHLKITKNSRRAEPKSKSLNPIINHT